MQASLSGTTIRFINVERVIVPFANNFHNAAAPQITQSYSSGDMERVYFLASRVGKYCMLMMALTFFPLWAELDFILTSRIHSDSPLWHIGHLIAILLLTFCSTLYLGLRKGERETVLNQIIQRIKSRDENQSIP